MSNKIIDTNNELQKFSNFVIFKTEKGKVNIDVFFHNETLWFTQKLIAELFEKGRSTITEHLKNIFNSGELDENSVCRDFRLTAQDGKNYNTKYYNLRAITAKIKAESEYDKFRVIQDQNYISDFDLEIEHLFNEKKEKQ